MTDTVLRVGSRTSRLALAQTAEVMQAFGSGPGIACEFVGISTAGDRSPDASFADIGEPGLFTGALEQALQLGEIDVAVHSLKDLETDEPEDLVVAAVLRREDPRDALVVGDRLAGGHSLARLPAGARIGTASIRRRAFVLRRRPDLLVDDIRGNVPTRLDRLAEGHCDALVLAAAGLNRLKRQASISEFLDPEDFVPAPGQGAVAVQARRDARSLLEILAPLDHGPTRVAVTAERAFLRVIEGGCRVPAGALATMSDGSVTLHALVCSPDGRREVRATASGPASESEAVGEQAAREALDRGARGLIEESRA